MTQDTAPAAGSTTGGAAAAAGSGAPPVQRPFLVLGIVLSATFMQLLDISIVNVATPSIQASLGATFSDVQLVLAGYQLAFACTLITGGRLGDIFGRRRLFLLGMTGFTLASALCGAAVTSEMLILSRVLQGLCSGLMFPQVLSVIQVSFAPKDRGRAFGVFGAVIGLGTIMGPVTGGVLIEAGLFHDAWRSIFFVNVPIGIVALVGAFLKLPESRAPKASRLDIGGALLVATGLGLLIYPLTEGRTKGWPGWLVAMLVVSVPLLVLFGVLQHRKTLADSSPLLDTGLFSDRAFRVGAVLSLIFFSGVPPFFFTFSLYLQLGEGFSALGAGLTTFAFALGSAAAAANSDRLAKRIGRRVLSIGTATLVAGMLLVILTVHLVGDDPHTYEFAPAFLIAGVGLGLFIAPLSTLILAAVTPRRVGSASGAISTVQQVGGAVGVAIIGLIFFGLLGANAPTAVAETRAGVEQSLRAAGLPQQAVPTVLAGFERCFTARSKAADPGVTPAACARLSAQQSPSGPEVGARVAAVLAQQGRPGSATQRRNFSRSIQQTLLYEVAVFSLAFGIVLALPRRADDGAPVGAPADTPVDTPTDTPATLPGGGQPGDDADRQVAAGRVERSGAG